MSPSPTRFQQLARAIGALMVLMGMASVSMFAIFLVTGVSPLAGTPLGGRGLELLVVTTVGGLLVVLGLPAVRHPSRSQLQVAGAGLAMIAGLRLLALASPEIVGEVGLAPLAEFLVFGGLAAVALWTRPSDQSAIELHTTLDLDAPASEVWQVLAEQFADVCTFASGVRHSEMAGPAQVGAVRTCHTEPFGPFASSRITEELTEFSAEHMRFAYVAGGDLPSFIPTSTNRWSIRPTADGCRIESHASIDLVWWAVPLAPLLGWSIHGEVHRFGRDLRAHIEGVLHSRSGQEALA